MKLSIRTFGLVCHLASVTCFKLAVNSSRDFPACEGKLISKTFGEQDGHCMSLSGDSSAAEATCKQSYDIDAGGFHWQCVAESKSSGGFTCRHSHMCQHEEDPAAEWDSLPVLSADVKPKMTFVDFEKSGNQHNYLARLTDNKFLICFKNGIDGNFGWQCQAVEEVVGGILTGDRIDIPANTQHGAQISENKVAICRHAGSILRCYTVTAEGRSFTKTKEQDMPNRFSPMQYTYMPTLLYLEEHKVLLCGNENEVRKVKHHLTCWVMTDKEGSLERGPGNTLIDSFKVTYGMVHTALLSAGKVLACYDAVERDGKFQCKILTIEGDSISAGPEQEFETGGTKYEHMGHLTAMTSTQALYCHYNQPHKCVLLSISGSTVKGVYILDLPKTRHPQYKDGVQRLWNDRVLSCWGGGYHGQEFGNPFCTLITCKDQKCTAGEAYHPTTSTKPGFPRSSAI